MGEIDFEAKTDRELLVLAAQRANDNYMRLEKINGRLMNHEKRINELECRPNCSSARTGWKSILRDSWQILSIIAVVIALIIVELSKRW
jgi:hypothetical protein